MMSGASHSQLGITNVEGGTSGYAGGGSMAHSKIERDPEEQLLRITDIVLTEVKEEDNAEEEIGDDGEVVQKKDKKGAKTVSAQPRASTVSASMGNLAEEQDDHADLDNSDLVGVDKKDRFRRNK